MLNVTFDTPSEYKTYFLGEGNVFLPILRSNEAKKAKNQLLIHINSLNTVSENLQIPTMKSTSINHFVLKNQKH